MPATVNLDILNNIRIASPCPARWEDMQGDDQRRFCGQCSLHVHDISSMTAADAASFLSRSTEGRVCVRLYRRADGRILTADCPVGWRLVKRRAARLVGRAASAAALLLGIGTLNAFAGFWNNPNWLATLRPYKTFAEWIKGVPPGPVMGKVVMGEVEVAMPMPNPAPVPVPAGLPLVGAPLEPEFGAGRAPGPYEMGDVRGGQ